MKRVFQRSGIALALSAVLFAWLPAGAQNQVQVWNGNVNSPTNPFYVSSTSTVQPTGVPLSNCTSLTASESITAHTITLTAPSSNITILASPSGANVYVQFNGNAATVSNFQIPAGFAFTFTGMPNVTSFSIIADGTSGTYSVFAH